MPVLAVLAAGLGAAICCYFVRRQRGLRSLADVIPGPRATSWLYGNMLELLLTDEYGANEFKWQEHYGMVYRIRGCFGASRLMISDPTAIKFIVNTTSAFAFGPSHHKVVKLLFGAESVVVARGEPHKYLRALMNPWFSQRSVRRMLPLMMDTARKLVDHWEEQGFVGQTVDVSGSLHTAILDVLGETIIETPLNGLAGQSDLSRIQRDLVDSASAGSKLGQLAEAILPYVPAAVFDFVLKLPISSLNPLKSYHRLTNQISRELLLQNQIREVDGLKEETFMGFLAAENASNPRGLPTDSVAAQVRSLLMAGDDTTGGSVTWVIYRLAQMPEYQHSLREEIRNAGAIPDFDRMPLLNAMINEVLRFYPGLPLVERVVTEDCVVPLSRPVLTTTGKQISELPLQKGQNLFVAVSSYHRLTSVWGEDAAEFKPSRWLGAEPPCNGVALGPHASLLSFLAGPHVCIGYRLAILEIQVFVTELVRKFALSLPEDDSVRPCYGVTLVSKTADGVQQVPVHVERVE